MSEEPKEPVGLNYATPDTTPRRGSTLKSVLFAFAILASLASLDIRTTYNGGAAGNSAGGAAAGLWVAFALIHVQDMKSGR